MAYELVWEVNGVYWKYNGKVPMYQDSYRLM